jgi:2-polyprenyl-6-hydroxyphenyl methylase/3-demethylubiquinone-9 3-methyltransferase
MARLGADIIGIDATERSVKAAQAHAKSMDLDIDYRFTSAEQMLETGKQYDVVLNMEVVEHVKNMPDFLNTSAGLVRPGGLMMLATLNRTIKSYAMAIIGAEYIMGWLPRGTHNWKKFVKPSELAAALRPSGLEVKEITGVAYNPLNDSWHLAANDVDVNYLLMATRPENTHTKTTK